MCAKILETPSDNLSELTHKIAIFHWWLCHATLYKRGSAAIADMFVKLLWTYHQYYTGPWKINCFPDCEALITPNPEEFAENYLGLFESVPIKKENLVQSDSKTRLENLFHIDKDHDLPNMRGLVKKFTLI